MLNKVSLAGAGLVGVTASAIIWLGAQVGLTIAENDAAQFVQFVLGAAGIIATYVGQYRRKDLVGGLLRREPRS